MRFGVIWVVHFRIVGYIVSATKIAYQSACNLFPIKRVYFRWENIMPYHEGNGMRKLSFVASDTIADQSALQRIRYLLSATYIR